MRRAHLISVPAALALAAAGLTATVAQADAPAGGTLYVNNSRPCSDTAADAGDQAVPFCTVQAAVDAVRAGQTVQLVAVLGDQYKGSVTLRTSGTPSAPITIDGGGDYLLATAGAAALTLDDVHDVVVRNVHTMAVSGHDGVDVTGSQDVTLDRMDTGYQVGNAPVDGIAVDGTSSDVTVSRGLFSGLVTGSAVHALAGARHIVVTTNEFTFQSAKQPMVLLDGVDDADVTSNGLNGGSATGISVTGASSAVIENNTVGTSTGVGLSVSADSAAQTTADYNDLTSTSSGTVRYSWAGIPYLTAAAFNSATTEGAHDYPLVSSRIDSADSDAPGELTTDYVGNPRAQDPRVPDTGGGTYGYYDRGPLEAEDAITHVTPTSALVTTPSDPVDEQPTPAPTSTWREQLTATVDFGDGSTQSAPVGTALPHSYAQPGVYIAKTTISNTDGYSVGYSRDVDVLTTAVEQPVLTAAPLRNGDGSHTPGFETFSVTGTALGLWQYSSLQLSYGDGQTGPLAGDYEYTHSGVYPVTLTATDLLGRTSTASTTAVVGSNYLPAQFAQRVYDSRKKGTDKVSAHGTIRVFLGQSTDAEVLNVTATDTKAAGYVTVYPDGTPRPTASNLNFAAGRTVANQATANVGPDGYVDLYNGSSGPIDLVVDAVGQYVSANIEDADEYHPAAPTRLVDTRTAGRQVPGHGSLTVKVPPSLLTSPGPDTLEVNVTAVRERSAGYATVYTPGQSRPLASELNWSTGVTTANLVTATADDQGRITLYNGGSGAADFVVDFVGYYRAATAADTLTGFVSTAPTRLLDTRSGVGAPAGQLKPGAQVKVCVPGPAGIVAAGLNLTVTGSSRAGYLVAYPDGGTRPGTSSINWTVGQTVANMTLTRTGADGCVQLHNGGSAPVSVIADLAGYQVRDS